MKVAFLVVIYNKRVNESSTINSFSKLMSRHDFEFEMLVWNNGPNVVNKDIIDVPYTIKQDLSNRSLSEVYNEFIDNIIADKYVILDDDTEIAENYIQAVYNKKFSLLLPNIIANDSKIYPIVLKLNPPKYISIGSGICLSRELAQVMKNKYRTVFDERFLFYGVDVTFFYRVNALEVTSLLNIGNINHSLSRLDKKSKNNAFRLKERCADLALQNRYYTSQKTLRSGIKFLCQMIFNLKIVYVVMFFHILIKGRHPNHKKGL